MTNIDYKEKIFMSPNNGALVIGIPLYRRLKTVILKDMVIESSEDTALAYVIDCGPELERLQFFNAEWVEEKLIDMGEL